MQLKVKNSKNSDPISTLFTSIENKRKIRYKMNEFEYKSYPYCSLACKFILVSQFFKRIFAIKYRDRLLLSLVVTFIKQLFLIFRIFLLDAEGITIEHE